MLSLEIIVCQINISTIFSMHILWFTNTPSCYKGASGNCYNGGGWISSLEMELKKRNDVKLGVCFYTNSIPELIKEEQENVAYYLLPRPHKTVKYIFETIVNTSEISSRKHEKLAMPALLKVIEDFRPDIIQIFGSENIYGLIAGYTTVPVVLHIQGILTPYLNAFLPPFVSWRMYIGQDKSLRNILGRMSDRIAWKRNSVTEQRIMYTVKNFMGRTVWDKRMVELWNPKAHYYHCDEILRDVFYKSSSKRQLPSMPVFVTIISSQLYKGYDTVLKAAKILKSKIGNFEWKVFGDVQPVFVEKQCQIKHDDVNVHLMGVASAEQIKDTLLHTTAYVHTSYIDNSPNSLCEALLLGVASIATGVGGIPSLIENGRTGFLIPANDPYQMAFLMKYLTENTEMNIEVGKKAKQIAMKRHDKQMIAECVMKIYADILSKQ